MSKVGILRAFVNERLTVAVEEICVEFGRTIRGYEDEVTRLKAENLQQQKRLDTILKTQSSLNRKDPTQVLYFPEEVSSEPQTSTSLCQEQSEPLLIKEEREDVFLGPEEAGVSKLTLLSVKCETDEVRPLSSHVSQSKTEDNRETESPLGTSTEGKIDGNLTTSVKLVSSDCFETDTEDRNEDDDQKDTGKLKSGLRTLKPKNAQLTKGQNPSVSNETPVEFTNQSPTPLCCKICEKSFPSKLSLMVHVRIHSRDCGLCGKHLEASENLKLHLQAHSTCNICGKTFAWVSGLQRHMKGHTGEKPFRCTVCGKVFSEKAYMKVHMRKHTGEKPFNCTICGKGIYAKGLLKIHMRSHTGEKPFICPFCGKGFGQKANLNVHVRNHTGEKPFGCSVCGKQFTENGALKRHMATHTGEKPFTCTVCGKGFARESVLRNHVTIHSAERPFVCIHCGQRFVESGQLKRHVKSHTPQKPYSGSSVPVDSLKEQSASCSFQVMDET